MWLQSPIDPDLFDDIRDGKVIAQLKAQGWVEAPPVWMKRPDGQVLFVTHPVHQVRLRREKDCVIIDGPPPAEDYPDEEQELALRDAEGYGEHKTPAATARTPGKK